MPEADARALFEQPARFPGLPRMRVEAAFCAWVSAPFSPPVSWTVYPAGPGYVVRRVMLLRPAPFSDAPTPWGADGFAPREVVQPWVDALAAIAVPPFASAASWGLDGTHYGVARGDLWLSARLAWWETPPPAWAPLAAWHAGVIAAISPFVPEHRDP